MDHEESITLQRKERHLRISEKIMLFPKLLGGVPWTKISAIALKDFFAINWTLFHP